MPKPVKLKAYSGVAYIYSDLMREVNYTLWAEYIREITRPYLKRKPKVLELSAGTCILAEKLKRYYKDLTATDISFEMLTQHSTKKNIRKVCCDMKALPFKTKFDLVFSTFDSLNYLTSEKSVIDCLKGIRKVLNDDGIFTFDASFEKNSYKHQKLHIKKGKLNDFSYNRQSIYMPASRIHKNIFYIRDKNDKLYIEVHRQKIYKFETWFKLIEKSGLAVIDCLEIFTVRKGKAGSYRVQFIVKKGKQ